jgi:hypothetical protein
MESAALLAAPRWAMSVAGALAISAAASGRAIFQTVGRTIERAPVVVGESNDRDAGR